MAIAVQVDAYTGPEGAGYVVVGELELAGQVWRKAVNVGPERHREHDWQTEGET